MGKNRNKWKKAEELKHQTVKAVSTVETVKPAQAPAVPEYKAPEVEKIDFDAWYTVRAARIPKHHHKEIIKADFKARGLGQCESLADFDDALKKYGIKLS